MALNRRQRRNQRRLKSGHRRPDREKEFHKRRKAKMSEQKELTPQQKLQFNLQNQLSQLSGQLAQVQTIISQHKKTILDVKFNVMQSRYLSDQFDTSLVNFNGKKPISHSKPLIDEMLEFVKEHSLSQKKYEEMIPMILKNQEAIQHHLAGLNAGIDLDEKELEGKTDPRYRKMAIPKQQKEPIDSQA